MILITLYRGDTCRTPLTPLWTLYGHFYSYRVIAYTHVTVTRRFELGMVVNDVAYLHNHVRLAIDYHQASTHTLSLSLSLSLSLLSLSVSLSLSLSLLSLSLIDYRQLSTRYRT